MGQLYLYSQTRLINALLLGTQRLYPLTSSRSYIDFFDKEGHKQDNKRTRKVKHREDRIPRLGYLTVTQVPQKAPVTCTNSA